MLDTHKREVNYLRVSVTDRCNLRCRYCMPEEGIADMGHPNMMTLEQIVTVINAGVRSGIRKIRLTGGEPLVRKGIVELVENIRNNQQIEEIAMTTNGILFADMAGRLKKAGLNRVNFSLDTLDEQKFRYITRHGHLEPVLKAIETAFTLDMLPVKINVVVMKGFNDDEILDFVALAKRLPVHVRFIEFMPIGDLPFYTSAKTMLVKEIRQVIEAKEEITKRSLVNGNGPAKSFLVTGGKGSIGFISAMSDHFCSRCNRLRLTADGKLRSCLYGKEEITLRAALEDVSAQEKLAVLFQEAIVQKPIRHHMEAGWGSENGRKMYQIGG